MKKVITYGVFDYLHLGHIRLFKNIKQLTNNAYLIVAVHADRFVCKTKPDAKLLYSESERIEMLKAIKYIDDVIVYDFIDTDLPKRDFDVLVVGPDQKNEHFLLAFEWCKLHHKDIIKLPRTVGISSSQIRAKIKSGG